MQPRRDPGVPVGILVQVAVLLLLCGRVHARPYYVSPTGDDNQSGTEAAPLRTIQNAADRARAGDTVVLRGGT